jgi:hypothetical protein
MCWGLVFAMAAPLWAQSATQPADSSPDKAKTREAPKAARPRFTGQKVGALTGDNVYVRSGSDRNYYPVTKLSRGDSVIVVGEQFGWLEILPPKTVHSLIDRNYVHVTADNPTRGVVNGRTWVYAGSNIDNRRYAKQTKLGKGAIVKVLGETKDGAFYKIEPPEGAHLWISGDYVDLSGGATTAGSHTPPTVETVAPGELDMGPTLPKVEKKQTKESGTDTSVYQVPQAPRTLKGLQTGKYKVQVNAIEAEITVESKKPISERVFEPIIAKLGPLAEQKEDELTRVYAETRIKQLQRHMELAAALKEMQELRENAISAASQYEQQRKNIKVAPASSPDGIVVRGMIQVSGIYDGSANRPKRWRIVSMDPEVRKTLAYIEIPPGSPIDPVQYYGKYVGIRASARRLMRGTIPPVPIYTVEEIAVLDPSGKIRKTGRARPSATGASGSPAPSAVNPDTRPAGTAAKALPPAASPEPETVEDARTADEDI